MFDTTRIEMSRCPSRIDVTERRAPTDESVRLLSEMQKAAEDKVVQAIRLDHNGFNAVVQVWKTPHNATAHMRCVFDFNGQKLTVEEDQSSYELNDDPFALVEKLRASVATRIAEEALARPFEGLMREGLFR